MTTAMIITPSDWPENKLAHHQKMVSRYLDEALEADASGYHFFALACRDAAQAHAKEAIRNKAIVEQDETQAARGNPT